MQITVLEATTGSKITLIVEDFDTISDVKAQIKDKEGIPVYRQKLTSGGAPLDNSCTLLDYGIKDGSTLRLYTHSHKGVSGESVS